MLALAVGPSNNIVVPCWIKICSSRRISYTVICNYVLVNTGTPNKLDYIKRGKYMQQKLVTTRYTFSCIGGHQDPGPYRDIV